MTDPLPQKGLNLTGACCSRRSNPVSLERGIGRPMDRIGRPLACGGVGARKPCRCPGGGMTFSMAALVGAFVLALWLFTLQGRDSGRR